MVAATGNTAHSVCCCAVDPSGRKNHRLVLTVIRHPFISKHEEDAMLNRALRLLRTYHQLTQVELAKRLGISNSYLSELESGDKSPGLELLDKYSEFFKMPVSSILLFSESMSETRKPGAKLRVAAADKILRLLEWLEERDAVHHQA